MKKLEDILVKELSRKLSYKYKNIYTNRKPSTSPKVKEYLINCLGDIPILQPEIDMIIETEENELYAIEVKLFKAEELNYNLPFYKGLGQAIALYRYGFDKVALFHFFLGNDIPDKIQSYGPEIWSFIRNDLQLPLDYSYIWVQENGSNYNYHVMQYINRNVRIKLLQIDDPNFIIKFKYDNPIKDNLIQMKIRECLNLWLNREL